MSAPRSDLSLYRRLLRQARPYWGRVAGVFLIDLLATPLALLTPVPLALAVDHVIGDKPLPAPWDRLVPDALTGSDAALLGLAVGLVVVVALLTQVQSLGRSLLSTHTGETLVLEFRARLFDHLQRLSLSYHDRVGTADSVYRVQYDALAVQTVVLNGVAPLVTTLVTVVAMIYVTARIEPALAAVAVLIVPVLLVLVQLYRKRLRRQWGVVKDLESSAMSVAQEALEAQRVVKAFGRADREEERFVRHSEAGVSAKVRTVLSEGTFNVLIALTTAAGSAAALFVGVRSVQAGTMTVGALVLVVSYLAQLYGPLESIGKRVAQLQNALASAARAYALLDETPEVTERPGSRAVGRVRGAVAFRSVSFAYPDGPEVLHDVSFEAAPGTRVGIAGRTGAGKSTLMSLLARFYDPTGGQVLLDGTDLRDYALDDLRRQYAIVLQESFLFSTTIAENIAYGRPGARHEDVVRAARAANAHGFISALEDGYETPVGERGLRLSGGERQRVALARAFLRDAPLLILDEPTSSVDVETEASIVEAMERLMQGRTTFMIAHRLSTLENCDLLLTLEHGRLTEATTDVARVLDQMQDPEVVRGA